MKKLFLVLVAAIVMSSSSYAQDSESYVKDGRDKKPFFQLGGDFVVPWRVDAPKGRLGMLAGGHFQAYLTQALTFDFTALFGVEDSGFAEKPIYLNPGLSVYLPTYIVQPYLSAALPILVNNGKDMGLQGSAGIQFGLPRGIALRYSVDGAYYFDSEAWIVNWVHASVAVNF